MNWLIHAPRFLDRFRQAILGHMRCNLMLHVRREKFSNGADFGQRLSREYCTQSHAAESQDAQNRQEERVHANLQRKVPKYAIVNDALSMNLLYSKYGVPR